MVNNASLRILAGPPVEEKYSAHLRRWGALPRVVDRLDRERSLDSLEVSGLRGRGGSGFPTAKKWRAVADGAGARGSVVVANGSEGEPASYKDRTLMRLRPHLVIDGLILAAQTVRAGSAILVVPRTFTEEASALRRALAQRRRAGERHRFVLEIVQPPHRYVAGESSAVVQYLNGGDARPTFTPPSAWQQGVRGRPTLVQNVETLAHVALIARYGSAWFREAGTMDSPGTGLFTVLGTVDSPAVIECALGIPLVDLARLGGGMYAAPQAALIGGYFGGWIGRDQLDSVHLEHASLRKLGGALGCGMVAFLGREGCGVAETAAVLEFFARESADQCGPCFVGLRAVANSFGDINRGAAAPDSVDRLQRWAKQIRDRGACHHPDGAVIILESALRVFADDIAQHAAGSPCHYARASRLLPVPEFEQVWQ